MIKSDRSGQDLSNESLVAKCGFLAAEHELLKVCQDFGQSSARLRIFFVLSP